MVSPLLHRKSYEAVQNTDPKNTKCVRPNIVKNLAALCAGTVIFFTSYDALTMLQSTMNRKGGIGVISQATVYAFFCVSAILLPKLCIGKFGSKKTSIAAMFGYLPYIASNYYPHWSLMIPSSVLLGIAGALLWASHGVYISGISSMYSNPAVDNDIVNKTAEEDDVKKSYGGIPRQNYHVSNTVADCMGLKRGEIEETSCLPSKKRQDYREYSHFSNGKSSDQTRFSAKPSLPEYQDSKFEQNPFQNSIPSFLPSLKRQVSEKYCTIQPHFSNEVSKAKSSNQPHISITSSVQESKFLESPCQTSIPSDQPSHEIKHSGESPMVPSHSSISKSSNQPRISAKSFFPENQHSKFQQSIPHEENGEENETKRLVAKATTTTTTSLLSSTSAKFFGFHGMAHLSSHIWSSLLSYFTLKIDIFAPDFSSNSTCRCGADFCSDVVSECFDYNAGNPGTNVRNALTTICICMCLISILVVAVFLDALDQEKKLKYSSSDFLNATCNILRRKEMLLLVPLSMHTGVVQAFYIGDFNKSFVACAWGTYHVGLVAVCYGMACGVSSVMAGWLVKHFGRRAAFSLAAVVNVISVVFLLLWTPDSRLPSLFFFASGLWGVHVGIVWSQLRALYGVLFQPDDEAAFSAFHFWSGLGSCVAFGCSNCFCISHKLYAVLALSALGFSGYYAVESVHCKEK